LDSEKWLADAGGEKMEPRVLQRNGLKAQKS
jgi:hypothetical protein